MPRTEPSFREFFGVLPWALIAGALLMLLKAIVVCDLWFWFATPFGLPALTYFHALGFVALISVFWYRYQPPNLEEPLGKQIFAMVGTSAMVYLLMWGFGAIVHYQM